ncbi:TPA: IS66 family insertion sequence element accessory protein TnpB [Salmonella enterica]|nr:IS66 family insertion sequence element accessory protein TnpB [Salmonella enterica]
MSADPYSGHLFVFRGKSGVLLKVLWAERDGLCLFTKRLEHGWLAWPDSHLTPAQFSMFLEGIDWHHAKRTKQLNS